MARLCSHDTMAISCPGLLWQRWDMERTWKSSLTMRAPSPTYFCTSSLPMTLMKHASVRLATARASSVLPVPVMVADFSMLCMLQPIVCILPGIAC